MSHVHPILLRARLGPRDPSDEHRVATPHQLFFALVFAVAISIAAARHHRLVEGHYSDVLRFLMVFFASWWA